MKASSATLLMLGSLCACGGGERVVAQKAVPAQRVDETDVLQVIRAYLMQDCGSGDPDPAKWLKKVVEFGARAVPHLLKAVEEGPPKDEQENALRQAKEDYQRLGAHLRQGGLEGIKNKDVLQSAQQLTEEQYTSMRLVNLARRYQEGGLNALAAIRDPGSVARLRALAARADLDESFKQRVREALKKFE